ncbi:MAG: hypothetical protein M3N53_06150 [Actinomycetota bacterium]|nr:hypothetical protein [Actinomycetota bacterium]
MAEPRDWLTYVGLRGDSRPLSTAATLGFAFFFLYFFMWREPDDSLWLTTGKAIIVASIAFVISWIVSSLLGSASGGTKSR